MTASHTILILGATGHFGGRICRRLLGENYSRLLVTSRTLSHAAKLVSELKQHAPHNSDIQAVALDHLSDNFEADLRRLSPTILIHTAGPYQKQSYSVARACIAIGCHYIDLADGRDFVTEFSQLNDQAREAGVLLVTGASTLPGLSSAIVDHFRNAYQAITDIEISIAPAHQTPRGKGTIAAVLSYCGKPFQVLEQGQWMTRYGWHNLKKQYYPRFGYRLSAACDVPDLSLMLSYVPALQTMTFHAALESPWEQWMLWVMGWLTRFKLVSNWNNMIPLCNYISEKLIQYGSSTGGMHVRLSGTDAAGSRLETNWNLIATDNHGPEIPCTPALVITKKLLRGELTTRGAMPCLNLMTLHDFDQDVASLSISWQSETCYP